MERAGVVGVKLGGRDGAVLGPDILEMEEAAADVPTGIPALAVLEAGGRGGAELEGGGEGGNEGGEEVGVEGEGGRGVEGDGGVEGV